MATREEYRKKYGATTLGQTGTAQTQKSISDGGVTREDYAKKYGMTTGLGRTNSSGFRRTAMQEAAEGLQIPSAARISLGDSIRRRTGNLRWKPENRRKVC